MLFSPLLTDIVNKTLEKNTAILYMDDDSDDQEMLEEAMRTLDNSFHLLKARDGHEGLQRLYGLKREGLLPCLIIMDLNMPRLNGRDTLARIKADELLATIPVVIFSTSNNPQHKTYFNEENVEYITKPVQYKLLTEVVKRLLAYCGK